MNDTNTKLSACQKQTSSLNQVRDEPYLFSIDAESHPSKTGLPLMETGVPDTEPDVRLPSGAGAHGFTRDHQTRVLPNLPRDAARGGCCCCRLPALHQQTPDNDDDGVRSGRLSPHTDRDLLNSGAVGGPNFSRCYSDLHAELSALELHVTPRLQAASARSHKRLLSAMTATIRQP
ncbi:hypothetical protein C0Q70_09919 [Pomacea canaliculata]|uniref:Uncharacterized protein n=1 Tax=Pomacea canaliculata TaxID=400727 RepID=A0A2T7PB57_POMCA|nr:hypothetical protein C0Q70_09919 [Pomacea canaliculata]